MERRADAATVEELRLWPIRPLRYDRPMRQLIVSEFLTLDGVVEVTVLEAPGAEWAIEFRVPDWAGHAELAVNGLPAASRTDDRGYVRVSRVWVPGDTITYTIPVEARLTVAHPAVDAVRGAVAIERGPVVYAFESVDQQAGVDLNHVELLRDAELVEEIREEFLGQPSVLVSARGRARRDADWEGTGWKRLEDAPPSDGDEVELRAIPYALWANRGPSVMRIFVPVEGSLA